MAAWITLTRPDGENVDIQADAVSIVEKPAPGENAKANSKLMISGTYRWFVEETERVRSILRGI